MRRLARGPSLGSHGRPFSDRSLVPTLYETQPIPFFPKRRLRSRRPGRLTFVYRPRYSCAVTRKVVGILFAVLRRLLTGGPTRHGRVRRSIVVGSLRILAHTAGGGTGVQPCGQVGIDSAQHRHQWPQESQNLLTGVLGGPLGWRGSMHAAGFGGYPFEVGRNFFLLIPCAQVVPVVLVDVCGTRRTTARRTETTVQIRRRLGRRDRMYPRATNFPFGNVRIARRIFLGRGAGIPRRGRPLSVDLVNLSHLRRRYFGFRWETVKSRGPGPVILSCVSNLRFLCHGLTVRQRQGSRRRQRRGTDVFDSTVHAVVSILHRELHVRRRELHVLDVMDTDVVAPRCGKIHFLEIFQLSHEVVATVTTARLEEVSQEHARDSLGPELREHRGLLGVFRSGHKVNQAPEGQLGTFEMPLPEPKVPRALPRTQRHVPGEAPMAHRVLPEPGREASMFKDGTGAFDNRSHGTLRDTIGARTSGDGFGQRDLHVLSRLDELWRIIRI